jgi:hypothetical protein
VKGCRNPRLKEMVVVVVVVTLITRAGYVWRHSFLMIGSDRCRDAFMRYVTLSMRQCQMGR